MANNNFTATENKELQRMKALMNYGRIDEKKQSYSGIENTKVGADGKTYGIIREGAKYFIKVSDKKNPLVEDFNYIGGFRNRKDYEYESFANAQKNFDMKMMSINEAFRTPSMVIESWENKGENNQAITEATKKMQSEIARQREIMQNVGLISEKKSQVLRAINEGKDCENGAPFCEDPEKEFKDAQKDNVKGEKPETGDAKDANKEYKKATTKGTDIKESEEVLGFNRGNDDYMDKSHGTEIGDSAPFDDAEGRNIDDNKDTSKTGEMKNGVVEEGASMHDADNQNTPTPGVGEVGDNQPFDGEKGRDIDEAIDDMGDTLAEDEFEDVDGEDYTGDMDDLDDSDDEGAIDDVDADVEGAIASDVDADVDADVDGAVEDIEADDAVEDDSVEDRLSNLEDLITKIADKLGVSNYEDDDLYDDEEGDDFDGDDFEDEEPIEDCVTYESKAYRQMRLQEAAKRARRLSEEGMTPFRDAGRVPSGNMNKLDDFGKHPAYQKKVMSLPPKDMQEFPDYYDMNDDSVKNDTPYGKQIGDGAPFEIDPEAIKNAIAESVMRVLKKKK